MDIKVIRAVNAKIVMCEIKDDYMYECNNGSTIEFPSNDIPAEEICYYRVLNEKSSFIEIKVNSKSRKIYCVTIVSINDLADHSEFNFNFDDLLIRKGNPVIDTELWYNKHIIDAKNNFSITFNADKLYLLFDNVKQATQRLILPNIELILDKNDYVIGYIFYDIPLDNSSVNRSRPPLP